MDFDLTSEQQSIRKLAKDFADKEIAPGSRVMTMHGKPTSAPSASRSTGRGIGNGAFAGIPLIARQ